jgi:dodecin
LGKRIWPKVKNNEEEELMTVVKVIELIGVSEKGWEDAVREGVRKASETIDNITGVEVLSVTARVKNGELTVYKANLKIAFGLTDR